MVSRRSPDRSPFNNAYHEALVSGCARKGWTQQELADQVEISLQALTIPTRRRNAISIRKLEQILMLLDTPTEEYESVLALWIEERLTSGAYGEAVTSLLHLLKNQVGKDRYFLALLQAVEIHRGSDPGV